MSNLLYEGDEWDFNKIKRVDDAIREIALNELKLDIYPNQIEIISSDQMLDAYSSHGMPLMYSHWSFGKRFLRDYHSYKQGRMGLAYEIVLNSNPTISYLMEENSMTMQTLVIAHAAYGHNHFFKNNYMFKQWTDAEAIIDYLAFAKRYISECEEKYGAEAVESILDACHAIMDHGIDKYRRPVKLNKQKEKEQQERRAELVQRQANQLWSTLPSSVEIRSEHKESEKFPKEPQENIMYFIEKHSPVLQSWQREIVRIVRKISQYFYPQTQTKLMNEGWASFVHYYIMNRLWEQGKISDGNYLEFIHSHSSVLTQLRHDSKYYNGFNPYALGFAMFSDIRRICTEPTDEDREYFPFLIGKDWLEVCLDAVANYRDESFVAQFLSPTLIRKWRLFEVTDNEQDDHYLISHIQNSSGYNSIRESLSKHYAISARVPDIQVVDSNLKTTRELVLKYTPVNNYKLDLSKYQVIEHLKTLWGYSIRVVE
jgi:stage V sporulation protein R